WRYVFFFQAEDGIRDFHVTGVQTCALPILKIALGAAREILKDIVLANECDRWTIDAVVPIHRRLLKRAGAIPLQLHCPLVQIDKIGRASCRERGGNSAVGGWFTMRRGSQAW